MILMRVLGEPEYPITSGLLDLIPPGVRALQIRSQPIAAHLPRISRIGRGIRYVPTQGRRFFIDLDGSLNAYLAKFKKKARYTIKRTIRIFAEFSGDSVQWQEYSHPAQMPEFRALAIKVSRKSYQHRQLRAGLDDSPSYWDEIVSCAADDRMRGHILFSRGTPVAYSLCRAFSDVLVCEKVGFDPAYAAYSPGLVLFYLVLQRLFSGDRFRCFDLGPGEYPYKARFATASIFTAEIYYFPFTYRNAWLVGVHTGFNVAEDLLKSILSSMELKRALKKVLRRGLLGLFDPRVAIRRP
jgi:Acetyltransferase (GNAT) domain